MKTKANADNKILGKSESDLCDFIDKQEDFGITDFKGDIFISSANRCRSTFEIFKKMVHIKSEFIQFDQRLLERHMGDFEGLNRDMAASVYPEFFCNRRFMKEMTPPNGESYIDFFQRVSAFNDDLFKHLKNQDCLIISHNQVLKMICEINRFDYADFEFGKVAVYKEGISVASDTMEQE